MAPLESAVAEAALDNANSTATEISEITLQKENADMQKEKDAAAPENQLTTGITSRVILVLVSIAVSLFLGSLDMTIVATSMPTIARELGGLSEISWVATAYLLTSAAPQALWGRLSETFGRQETLLFCITLFMVSSAICGAAPTMTVLIVGRALQGLGGGGMPSVGFVIVAELVPVRQRGMVQGFLQLTFAVSSIVGPLLGGALADHAGWRWIFYVNLPIGALAWLGIFFFCRIQKVKSESMLEKLRALDWAGSATITTASVLLLIGLTFGSQAEYGWSNPTTISTLVLGAALYPVFALIEAKFAKIPMVPLHLFKNWNYRLLAPNAFILGINTYGPTYYIPLWFQIMRDASATNSGLSFLPGFLMSTVTGFAIGIITTKTGYVLPFYQTGFAIIALGMGLDSLWRASMPYSQQAVLLGVVGMGFGFIFVTSMMIVQASVPPKEIGPGTTSISFIQTMGGIIGLSIFNVVLMTSTGTVLEPKLAEVGAQFGIPASVTASMAAGVLGGPISTTLAAYAAYIPAGSAAYEAVVNVIQDSVGHAFSVVFLAIGCINVLPFISSLFLRKPNLSGGSIAQLEGKKKEGAVEEGAEAEAGAKDAAKGDVEDEAATMAVAGH